jgi:hypothetical protein
MIEDLIKFYTENLTFNAIVIKKNGFIRNLLFRLLLFSAVGVAIYFLIIKMYLLSFLCIPILLLSVRLGLYFNSRTIKKHYPDIYISKFKWSNEKISTMIYKRLDEYLKEHDLDDNVDDIKQLVNEKAKNERLPFILYSTGFIALFIPLWNTYIEKFLDYFKNDIEAISIIALVITVIIASIAIYIPMIHSFRDSLFSRYKKLINLSELLDDYKLRKK